MILLCLLPGCGDTRQKDNARYGLHVQRGVEAYTRGNYHRALMAFEKALQFNTSDPQIHLYLGELYDDYLGDKLKAIEFYREFLKRSQDEKLKARVEKWITQAEKDAVGESAETGLVAPEDPDAELKAMRTKAAQALLSSERYRARVHELESALNDRGRPPVLPWLVAVIGAAAAVAVIVLARLGRFPGAKRPVVAAGEKPTLKERAILGRYFWVENEFNLGTLAISREHRKIRVESRSISTNSRSIGYGSIEQDTLKADLTNESGLTAHTLFQFSPDATSFTATWTDELGPGKAIGVREQ